MISAFKRMRTSLPAIVIATAFAGSAGLSHADIAIGVSLPLTGPASGLGIPMANGVKLWKKSIAGETLKILILDDAGDPGKGAQNARRFVTEDKVDLILGSGATPVAIAMADVASEAKTTQLAMSPAPLPPGRDTWTFRVPHSNGIMAEAIVNHMKKNGVKTVGFIGYTDAYGESWLSELKNRLDKAGLKLVGAERFARTDTNVTGQALKLSMANPDAIVVVASGSGAAMPQLALVDRGFKGRVYQTHAAATRDLIRVGGKGVEGALVSSAPMVVADQLPDNHPLKVEGVQFIQNYEKAYGVGTRNALAAHAWDAFLLLEKAVPIALQKAKPGTPEFRSALRDALESMPAVVVTGGVLDYTSTDHWGYREDSGAILKVVNGDWKLAD
jgi:branched-chain amino acid transport system substrate-binding protein